MKIGKILILSFVFLVISAIAAYLVLFSSGFERFYYDLTHDNKAVNSEAEIHTILSKFEKVHFTKLPKSYVENGKYNLEKYKALYQNKFFYRLKREQSLQKIVGAWRIADFVSRDEQPYYNYFFDNKDIYWLTDDKVLVAFLKLKHDMEKKNFDWDKIWVSSSHRSPNRNKKVGGAPQSRHICGDAIDLDVGDIDRNGTRNQQDKLKILDLCENIIGNNGGIGLYPGTFRVHIDMRGHHARWTDYKPDK